MSRIDDLIGRISRIPAERESAKLVAVELARNHKQGKEGIIAAQERFARDIGDDLIKKTGLVEIFSEVNQKILSGNASVVQEAFVYEPAQFKTFTSSGMDFKESVRSSPRTTHWWTNPTISGGVGLRYPENPPFALTFSFKSDTGGSGSYGSDRIVFDDLDALKLMSAGKLNGLLALKSGDHSLASTRYIIEYDHNKRINRILFEGKPVSSYPNTYSSRPYQHATGEELRVVLEEQVVGAIYHYYRNVEWLKQSTK